MSRIPSQEEVLFADAVARPALERLAFLDGACKGDAELHARILALLAAHAGPESLLCGSAPPREILHEEKTGDAIGRYKLLQKIGEGGCGVVWMAEQEEPVRRRVALKVIKLGMDTKSVVARFEAERQALAMMDHPCIAKVHDAGSTDTGRPFFVMELVRGIPITRYCDENHLTPTARLELFIKVCQAIQHAHQKGVIHRDIKPSNILVTVNDGAPTPKVIDFGIAKATQGRLTDATVFTAFEQFIGTPVYMSPEQAEMSSLDIDTRSDIYSLGVLLYELLAGRPPFDPKAFAQAGVDQIRQQIREVEPAKPSRRLGTMDDGERMTIAKLRSTAPAQLSLMLRGDLDWVVMRCIEKDRTRRYDTANGLAMDIQRYLRNEPVVARPPSTRYLVQKLIRRHRIGVVATGVVALVLIAGTAISTWQAVLANRAKQDALQARAAESEQRKQAEASATTAFGARVRAEAGELATRRAAYAADMNLVQQALEVNQLGRAQMLLDRHRPIAGQEDLRDWEWRYLWQQSRSDDAGMLGHMPNGVSSLVASLDGKWIAVGGRTGRLSVWNARTRVEVVKLDSLVGQVRCAFSPAEPIVAYSAARNAIRLWNIASGQLAGEIEVGNGACLDLAFSHDGRVLAVAIGGNDSHISTWDVSRGQRLGSSIPLEPRDRTFGSAVAFSRDLRLCADTVGQASSIRIRELSSGGKERWVRQATDEPIMAVEFSDDGAIVATGYSGGQIVLWETSSGKRLGVLEGHRAWVGALRFWPDGSKLVSASADQMICIWNLSTMQLEDVLRGHQAEVWRLSLLPSQPMLLSGSKDGAVLFWDTSINHRKQERAATVDDVRGWHIMPDNKSVLVVSSSGRVLRLRGDDFQKTELVADLAKSITHGEVSFSIDGELLAAASDARVVELHDLSRGVVQGKLVSDAGPMRPHAFLASGTRLVTASAHDDRWRIWEVSTGREIQSWQSPWPATSSQIHFWPDERRYVLFKLAGANPVVGDTTNLAAKSRVLPGAATYGVAVSPDNKFCAIASGDGYVNVWDTGTMLSDPSTTPATRLSGFLQGVLGVKFSSNGRRLATANDHWGEAVKLWDVASWREVLTLRVPGLGFWSVSFSADAAILGVQDDRRLHLWRAPSWEKIEAAEKRGANSR